MLNSRLLQLLLITAPCLTAASYSTYYGSVSLGLPLVDIAEARVNYGTWTDTSISTRNEVMADVSFSYDVYKMAHSPVYYADLPLFQITYRYTVSLKTNVAYANGMFGWFTEHGNTKCKGIVIHGTVKNWGSGDFSSRFVAINAPATGSGLQYTVDPIDNASYYGGAYDTETLVSNIAGRYYIHAMPYYTGTYITNYNLTKADTPAYLYATGVNRKNTSEVEYNNTVSHPNADETSNPDAVAPENGETLKYFGSFYVIPPEGMSTMQLELHAFSELIIAEGDGWGSCSDNSSITNTIYISI